uniref:Uncharacterized protein n=1 Tax=Panagrellus redivivus TaxID=6233 RepID=A0A7E4UV81_PANRE
MRVVRFLKGCRRATRLRFRTSGFEVGLGSMVRSRSTDPAGVNKCTEVIEGCGSSPDAGLSGCVNAESGT